MIRIQKYDPIYEKDIQHVYLWAGSSKTDIMDDALKVKYSVFCHYYITCEADSCFIAVDEQTNKAIGYCICAKNYNEMEEKSKKYIAESNLSGLDEKFNMYTKMYQGYMGSYDAHLHIDILEEYQRKGIGHLLMDALIHYLQEQRVNGVMLGVAANNQKGINFYTKYGYHIILENEYVKLMGYKTNKDF